MVGNNFKDVLAFLAVARERSFTLAAAQLGVSQSALSHTIRNLETRLEVRLLTRTTRSVSPTEAGMHLIEKVTPRFNIIQQELEAFEELKDKPTGTIRITASDFAVKSFLWPKLSSIQRDNPNIKIELAIDAQLVDIKEQRYDGGVRFSDQIAKNMSTVQISPEIEMAIVASPTYFAKQAKPKIPEDLTQHQCINTRYSVRGSIYAWELSKGAKNMQVQVDGNWIFNCISPTVDAALAGFGLTFVPKLLVQDHIKQGTLVSVLEDWCPTFPAMYYFYASRNQISPAHALVIEALRHQD